ncbi:hypothetical protein FJZ31_00615 [Candidatus Poribacteria bacterium]|nr:hypothetical protein [Candidatus Poribacteria bacterium]
MRSKYFLISIILLFTLVCIEQQAMSKKVEIRVRGGRADEFKDSKGRVWYPGQKKYSKDDWGGWIENLPQTAEVAALTDNAKKMAKDAGYDEPLFYAVSWAAFPLTVKHDINTGNGIFDVTYLVGEHWSPNNRGYDIFIEGENVLPLYVTPGNNEIDIKKFEGIEVKDSVMNFHFAGNAKTGKGDLNAMFSGLEIVTGKYSVEPNDNKLTATWGKIKASY